MMSWVNEISQVLQSYTGAAPAKSSENIENDFDQVAQSSPPGALADGLSEAFRSNQTPPFPQMLAQLFARSNGEQKAGILNRLLAILGSGPGATRGGLSGLLGMLGGGRQVSPETAYQVSPQDLEKLAEHAERRDPRIVDEISGFYAQHPQLVKTLGGAALTILMAKIAQTQFPGTRA